MAQVDQSKKVMFVFIIHLQKKCITLRAPRHRAIENVNKICHLVITIKRKVFTMSNKEYLRIKNSIIRSGKYITINGYVVQDARVLTENGFVDFFDYIKIYNSTKEAHNCTNNTPRI